MAICRLLLGVFILFIGAICSAADPTPNSDQDKTAQSLVERVAEIKKLHQAREKQFYDELQAAKHDDEKVGAANKEYQESVKKFAEELKSIIKEHPVDPAAFDAADALVGELRYFLDDNQARIILDHHLADDDMGQFCFHLRIREGEDWARHILEAAAEKHPDENVRGQAIFAMGDFYCRQATPWGRELPDEKRQALFAKATEFYRQAAKNYANIPTPDGKTTLGEKAKHELARLQNMPNLKIDRPAPPIVGEDLEGKPMSLEEYRGKVVVVVFWGSWCGPCMAMVPHEQKLYERYRDAPFVLLGVNCGDPRDTAKATVEKRSMLWRCWWDGEETRGPIETDYDIQHWPSVFVIDAKGIFRGVDVSEEQLDEVVEKALAAGKDATNEQ